MLIPIWLVDVDQLCIFTVIYILNGLMIKRNYAAYIVFQTNEITNILN